MSLSSALLTTPPGVFPLHSVLPVAVTIVVAVYFTTFEPCFFVIVFLASDLHSKFNTRALHSSKLAFFPFCFQVISLLHELKIHETLQTSMKFSSKPRLTVYQATELLFLISHVKTCNALLQSFIHL